MLLKNPVVETIKVGAAEEKSLSFFPVLYSCHFLAVSAILLSSFHLFFFYPLISYPPVCFCIFFSLSLDRHVQSHHGHHKPFKCKLCPFKSSYASRLKSHLHKAHTGKKRHTDTYIKSHLAAVCMTNKVFPGQNSSLLLTTFRITMLCLI